MPPAPHLPSTLQMLEAVAASNNHHRDLSFLCSGISLSYHQSILFFHSPFLTNLLGSLACCKCEKAQCGRKEEVVIVLDNVEVGTVQGLMEYLYRGECIVKDRRGYKEIQKLVEMLGIKIKLEIKSKDNNLGKVAGRNASEPNLEETVNDSLPEAVARLEDEQIRIAEDILKFIDKFCETDEDQKCSKCDEWLNKENFMEHFKKHKDEFQASLQTVILQKKLANPVLSHNDELSNDTVLPCGQVNEEVTSENESIVTNKEAKKTRLTEQVMSCMDMFERGMKEMPCTECGEVIAKEVLIDHYKNHVNQINGDSSKLSSSKIVELKKRGPKPGGRTRKVSFSRVKKDNGDIGEAEPTVTPSIENNVKEQLVYEDGENMQKSKSKVKKNKISEIANVTTEEVATDEYTCFNPTFKIKPGTKKVGTSVTSSPVVVPVPEIKLTFNLNDLGIAQETIKLQDLSLVPKVGRKRKAGFVDFPLVRIDGEVSEKKREVSVKKKRKVTKVLKSGVNVHSLNSSQKTKEVQCETYSDSSSIPVATTTTSTTFSLPSSTSCTSFPLFLRAVCGQADSVLPPGLDREQGELGRRVVHRLTGQRLQEGDDRQITQEDVFKEMIDGIEDDEDDEDLNNVSSDGSDAPLVMDLSEHDL